MARWMAIVALLLGFGFTAFESFNAPLSREAPMVQSMEGGSGFPTPRPSLTDVSSGASTPATVSVQ